ncbi:hypothetical protein PCASD_08226 [Puccinia coronata f. sp. avenae]|uniref:hAT-like transposase RNase-H fold domain-containing protein n=1 Tax=Puccinia coronata f. sp. avenae TaxID=200324 RepID=A0A2N5ULK1_9BASI|nr:hypothetical protein PCASD_08226 [Puccinia coronata f. sp. avenae]
MARPSTPDEIPTIPNHHATPACLPPPPQIRQSACKKNPTITPGFISTQNDSRQTLTIPADVDNGQNETAQLRSSAINKTLSGKNSTQTNPSSSKETTSTPEAEAIYDIIQDSDDENKKAAARSLKSKADRKIAPRKDGTDTLPNCSRAIASGCKLPDTASQKAQDLSASDKNSGTAMSAYVTKGRFDNNTLNKLLVFWLIQHSLPWSHFEDKMLRIAFNYLDPHSKLHSRTWAATTSQNLYLDLQQAALRDIKNAESKISLVSDVCTTKGGHKAFIGISHDGTFWDHSVNHQRCFCHVLSLILGAGLKAIKLSTAEGPAPRRPEPFTTLETIDKEGDLLEDAANSETNNMSDCDSAVGSERGVAVDSNEHEKKKEKYTEAGIGWTLKKIDYVCRRIASSPAKQSEFKVWAQRLGYEGPGIIGGYGIRWNIAYNSRNRAYKAHKVINQLLENETKSGNGKKMFKGYELSSRKWDNIKVLNLVLKEFLELTKRMKGDGPSCTMVLYEYSRLIESLEKLKQSSKNGILEEMFDPMITVANKYKDLALECEPIFMATMLHPAWQLLLFLNKFQSHHAKAQKLLLAKFKERQALLKPPTPLPDKNSQHPTSLPKMMVIHTMRRTQDKMMTKMSSLVITIASSHWESKGTY